MAPPARSSPPLPAIPTRPTLGAAIRLTGFSTTEWANTSTIEPDAILFPAGVSDGTHVRWACARRSPASDTDLASARATAYRGMDGVSFPNMQVRRDIGWRAPVRC